MIPAPPPPSSGPAPQSGGAAIPADPDDLAGRTAIVTGGTSGIGLATARLLVRAGCGVVAVGRDPARAAGARRLLEAEARGPLEVIVADVTDEGAMDRVADRALALGRARGGRLDFCVASAGIDGAGRPALELTAGDFRRVLEVNVIGLFLAARAAAVRMAADGQGGAIVLNASVNAFIAEPGFADYNASKAAAVALARTMARELASAAIRVNAICAGYTRTPMTEGYLADPDTAAAIRARIPMGRVAEPEEIARAIVFLLSPAASYITGSALVADGGWMA